ncbi:MAG: 2-C-methyl-D-erythritol 4-phosphate cytidylyltransferase [Acidobacteria bacterium]|nr:2-C-methyl-D-erythritol 4-phosphate cytidylyltransferase [Acidobacteriota bacterium]
MNTAIIVAAGSGTRFGGDKPKQFVDLAGKPILVRTIEKFDRCDSIDKIVVVAAEDLFDEVQGLIASSGFAKRIEIVAGGKTRAESTRNGLSAVKDDGGVILVHDAARPLVSVNDIERVVEAANEFGAACLTAPVTDTIKRVSEGEIRETVDRSSLMSAQTPQGFTAGLLRIAFAEAADLAGVTDESSLIEGLGEKVKAVPATSFNPKITTQEDLRIAEAFLGGAGPSARPRIGFGTDLHRLEPGGPLILGGVSIDCDLHAVGHSDADVLLHAVADAILGAMAAGDIGSHFSDADEEWRAADSRIFLAKAVELAREKGFAAASLDAVIDLERPKLRPHIEEMRRTLADLTGLDVGRVSVKAKTGEGLGEIGSSRAISASAVVILFAARAA